MSTVLLLQHWYDWISTSCQQNSKGSPGKGNHEKKYPSERAEQMLSLFYRTLKKNFFLISTWNIARKLKTTFSPPTPSIEKKKERGLLFFAILCLLSVLQNVFSVSKSKGGNQDKKNYFLDSFYLLLKLYSRKKEFRECCPIWKCRSIFLNSQILRWMQITHQNEMYGWCINPLFFSA